MRGLGTIVRAWWHRIMKVLNLGSVEVLADFEMAEAERSVAKLKDFQATLMAEKAKQKDLIEGKEVLIAHLNKLAGKKMDEGDEARARDLVNKAVREEALLEALKQNVVLLDEKTEDIRTQVASVGDKVQNLRNKKDFLVARKKMADLTLNVEKLVGCSFDVASGGQALEGLEDAVRLQEARASVSREHSTCCDDEEIPNFNAEVERRLEELRGK